MSQSSPQPERQPPSRTPDPCPAGDLAFTVGDLALALAPAKTGAGTPGGQDGAPPEAQAACTAEQGQDQVLATVPLAAPGSGEAPEKPEKREAPAAGEAPPDCRILQEEGWQFSGCLYMNGFSNVRKLGGAAVLNDPEAPPPALTSWWMPRMSPPAHSPRSPAPVSTTVRTVSSDSQASRASCIRSTMAWLSALRARGRLRRRWPAWPDRLTSTGSSGPAAVLRGIRAG